MPLEKSNFNKKYASIIQGKLKVQTDENDPEAKPREWESSDGKSGTKYEREYDNLRGIIDNIYFKDTDYGTMINIEIDKVILSMNTANKYGSDLMRKLPGVVLEEEVNIVPWQMEKDGVKKSGLIIYQDKDKIDDYFYDWEKKKEKNGMPKPDKAKSKLDKDDWKMYFINVKKFLIEYITKNVLPKMEEIRKSRPVEDEFEEIDVDAANKDLQQASEAERDQEFEDRREREAVER